MNSFYRGYAAYKDLECLEMLMDLESLEMLMVLERRENKCCDPDRTLDLDTMDGNDFRQRYCFSKATVESIVEMLSPKLNTNPRLGQLKPAEKVCTALRFFVNGEIQSAVAESGGISQVTASRAINTVAKCLAELGKSSIQFPSKVEANEIARRFKQQSGFPGVVGALDCLQVPIVNPGEHQAWQFKSQEGICSLNIQTLNDDRLKIRNIVTRWPGATPSWLIFDKSRLKAILESDAISDTTHVLAGEKYHERPYLFTPIPSPKNESEYRYNIAHGKALSSVERTYELWKGRFSCLSQTLRVTLPNTQNIIIATAVLHNMAIDMGDVYENRAEPHYQGPSLIESSAAEISRRDKFIEEYFA